MSVIVAFLRTPEGQAAWHSALDLARRNNTKLIAACVCSDGDDLQIDRDVDDAQDLLEDADLTYQITTGNPTDSIADVLLTAAARDMAENNDTSGLGTMIVLGIIGRRRMALLRMGAGVNQVLLEAPCPVLVVKPDITT